MAKYSENIQGFQKKSLQKYGGAFSKHPLKSGNHRNAFSIQKKAKKTTFSDLYNLCKNTSSYFATFITFNLIFQIVSDLFSVEIFAYLTLKLPLDPEYDLE